jgi:hypothetical protein
MTVPTDTPLSAEPAEAWTRLLLQRRTRPGLVDIAHARGLGARNVMALGDPTLLRRLLARRGTDERLIASGTLVLAQPPIAQPAAAGIIEASPQTAVHPTQPTVSARGIVVDRVIDTAVLPRAPISASAPRIATGVALANFAGQRLARATISPALPDASGIGAVATPGNETSPTPEPAMPRARDLPGPAIGADLLLPPNTLAANARRAAAMQRREAQRSEINGEPVDSEMLTLVRIAAPNAAVPAEASASSAFTALSPVGAAMPGSRSHSARTATASAATHAAIDTPPVVDSAEVMALLSNRPESRQLAESVGRELVRSLRRAHERRGASPWKS